MCLWRAAMVLLATWCSLASAAPDNTVYIVMPRETSAALKIGRDALTNALRDTGLKVGVLQADAIDTPPTHSIIAGHSNPFLPQRFLPNDLAEDGFVIRPADGMLVVAGRTDLSDAFGLSYLAERIHIGETDWRRLDLRREPHFKIRMASGCTMEEAVRRGYNTWLGTPSAAKVVTFESVDPGFFSPEQLGARRAVGAEAHSKLKRIHDLSLKSFGGGDEFQFPSQILHRPYTSSLMELDDSAEFCMASDPLWDIYRAKFREFAQRFSETDYYMMRLGENYSSLSGGALVGNGVYHYDDRNPYCDRCKDLSYEERIARVINETQAVLADSPIRYIHRTWDTRQDRMHADAQVFQRILNLVPARKDILWSIKYTKTDFWRYNFPNPCIGVGDVPQIIEFQCQREYEGKGAYPNYVGPHVAAGHRLAAQKGAVGVWHWHHGGGWGGPYLATDLWNDANIYVAAHLAWTPMEDPQVLAHEWAAITFGADAADDIAELLMLSTEAVRKQRYFEAYSKNHFGWTPARNWMRDDKIRGTRRLSPIYGEAKEQVDAMIAEKEEAVQLVGEMLRLAKAAQPKISTAKTSVAPPAQARHYLGEWIPDKPGTYSISLILEGSDSSLEIPLDAKANVSESSGVLNNFVEFSYGKYTGHLEVPLNAGLGKHYPLRISMPSEAGLRQANIVFTDADRRSQTSTLLPPNATGTLGDHLISSVEYQYALTNVTYTFTSAYFLFRRWKSSGNPDDKSAAAEYARDWTKAWKDYRRRIPTLPGAATLYHDDGMEATMARIVRNLN
jgi:hypothetical protein